MKYLAIGPFAWGKGKTQEEAVRNCKPNIAWIYVRRDLNPVDVYVYEVSDGTYVNDMGGFNRPKDDPAPKLVATVKVRRPRR